MALKKHPPIEIPLAVGVNNKIVDKLLPKGFNAVVENGYFDKDGAVRKLLAGVVVGPFYNGSGSLRGEFFDTAMEHRGNVYLEGLWDAGDSTAKRAVGTYDPDSDRLEFVGYDQTYNNTQWAPAARTVVEKISKGTTDVAQVQTASVNGYTTKVWHLTADFGTAYLRVTEDATGRVVYEQSKINTTEFKPVVFEETGNESLGWIFSTGSVIQWQVFNTVTLGTSSGQALVLPTSALWDVAWRSGSDYLDIYYFNGAAGEIYHIGVRVDGTVLQADASLHAEQPKNVLSVARVSAQSRHILTWQSNSSSRPRYSVIGASGLNDVSVSFGPRDVSTDTANVVRITGGGEGTAFTQVAVEYAAAGGVPNYIFCMRHTTSSGASTRPPRSLYHATIVAKMFDDNRAIYLPIASTQSLQETYYLVVNGEHLRTGSTAISWSVAAKALGDAAGELASVGEMSEIANHATGLYGFGGRRRMRLISDGQIIEQAVEVRYQTHGRAKRSTNFGRSLLRTGGYLGVFDGFYLPMGPFETQGEFALTGAGTGGSMSDGTYNYKLVAEFQTQDGRIYRSRPSAAQAITLSGGGALQSVDIDFYVPPVLIERQNYGIEIYAYRTTDGGSVYFNTGNSVKWRDDAAGTLTLTDTVDDTDLADNELLYTEGGFLENVSPPPSDSMVKANGRLWVLSSDERSSLWVSKPIADNVGVSFAAELVKPLGFDAVAIEHMDGRIIVFEEEAIHTMPAIAPNDTGSGAFGPLTEIARGVGCVDSNSIHRSSDGIYFKSNDGIRLLDRSNQVLFIGAPVEDFDSFNVLKIEEPHDRGEIWFLTDEHRFLIYNTEFKRWSYSAALTGLAASPVDVIFFGGNRYIAPQHSSINGYVLIQSPTDHTGVQLLKTPWLRIQAISQLQRVFRAAILGEWRSAHTLTVDVYVDWDETTPIQTVTLDASSGYTLGDVEQIRISMARQRLQVVRFAIYDADLAGTKEGFRPSMLVLETAGKRGIKLDAAISK